MENKFYKALVCSNVGSFEELFQLIRENCQLLKPLYAYKAKFSGFLNYLLERTAVSQDYEKVFGITIDFLACNLVKSPEDIIACLQNIKRNNLRILFTKELIRNPLLNKDVLISLGQDIKAFQSLPYDMCWLEVPVIQYGKTILSLDVDNLSVKQICPLIDVINDESLIEFLLGWAFEDNKLDREGIEYFKARFPKKYETISSLSDR